MQNHSTTIEEDQVQHHLWNLKLHKPTGMDNIHPEVLRELAKEAA